jgi:hypothetical protein
MVIPPRAFDKIPGAGFNWSTILEPRIERQHLFGRDSNLNFVNKPNGI